MSDALLDKLDFTVYYDAKENKPHNLSNVIKK